MTPIEALADAIMAYEGWHLGSRSYRNRNPGNLRASESAIGADPQGYARFRSLSVGYDALLFDLTAKATGKSEHHLTAASTILDLMDTYAPASDGNNPSSYCSFVCSWLTRAIGRLFTRETEMRELLLLPLDGPTPAGGA